MLPPEPSWPQEGSSTSPAATMDLLFQGQIARRGSRRRDAAAGPGQPLALTEPGREERVEKVQGGIIKTLGLTPQQEAN